MKQQLSLLALLGILCLVGCKAPNENLAGVKHFYFEIHDEINSAMSDRLSDYLNSELPKYDYLISDASAKKDWPFYGKVERGSKVLKSDMMPPHTNVNRFSPIASLKSYNDNEHTMKVVYTYTNGAEGNISIIKESFAWKDEKWVRFSKKLATDFYINEQSEEDLFIKITKTLIRYTFK